MMFVIVNFVLVLYFSVAYSIDDVHLASKAKADQIERMRCGYNLMKLWTAEIAHTPFAAAPLIADINADGKLNIVAAPLSESQTVIEAETGKTIADSKWPTQKLDTSILASPVQFDINSDGMLDVLFVTFSGELIFYTPNGTAFKDRTFEIPPVYVQQNWYKDVISASGKDVNSYLRDFTTIRKEDKSYLPVDAHVMATPILADMNNDKRMEELVIPVSYFFDEEDYRLPENFDHINNINDTDLGKYVVSGVTIVNLTSLEIIHSIFLDLTTKTSGFPAYVLFSPTVIDMDRDGGHLEIVIGTSAGNVHVIDIDGELDRDGFPYSMGIIHGQLTVADVNKDSTLEIIAIDTSGNVICLNEDGTMAWEVSISGDNSPGSRLHDVDNDGYLDVIIPTNEGDVYAIHGVTGKLLDKWPIKVGHPILSNVLITKISSNRKGFDIVFLSNDGALHIVSTDQTCRTHFPIGETSLVQILSHDLVVLSEGLEVLISTNDGTLICMGSGEETDVNILKDEIYENTLVLALTGDTKSPNDFTYAKFGIYVHESSRIRGEVTGSMFHIDFNIQDPTYVKTEHRKSLYSLMVYFGSHLLFRGVYANPGVYSIFVDSYPRPSHGHVTLVLSNINGQIATEQFPIRFNQIILEDLQWLLMAPFVTMVIILLVNHGFPAKDLLPVTLQSKER